jgi:DNA repair protein RecO (recombination protein O)
MNWDDSGFLISKNRYNENSLITEFYTENHGKVTGIIFGGTSKKIKNYLQIGNKLHINYNTKSVTRIGYFKVEILTALTPNFFDDIQKLSCISCAMNLIKILTAENQDNKKVFNLIDSFFLLILSEEWVKNYIFWELELLKLLGYDLDLKNFVEKKIINNKTQYFAMSKVEKKYVPSFLIEKKNKTNDIKTLLSGLKLVGDYLEKTILKPNNINYPYTRSFFINSLR